MLHLCILSPCACCTQWALLKQGKMKKYLPHYFEFHSGRLADDLHNRCLSHLRKQKKHESLLVIYDLGNSLMFYGVVVCLFERDYFFSLHMEGRDIIVLKTREQREKWVTHLDHYSQTCFCDPFVYNDLHLYQEDGEADRFPCCFCSLLKVLNIMSSQ